MKIINGILMLVVLGLFLLGVLVNFIANEDMLKYFIFGGLGFSAVILALILVKMLREGSAYAELMRSQGKSPLIGVIALVVMLPAMSVTASFKGLPAALNYAFGSEGLVRVTIKSKPSRYYSANCPGRVDLQGYSYFTNDRVCGIQESDWKGLKPGHDLILVGKRSVFGIQYARYKN